MTIEKSNKVSWPRIILGSLLVTVLALFHFNLLLQGQYLGIGFIVLLAGSIYLSRRKTTKEELKHFQYKTASILSFLLPVSAMIYSFVFAGMAVQSETSEAAQAGAAIGSAIGGSIVIVLSFIIGLSLGIVFHLMSRPKKG